MNLETVIFYLFALIIVASGGLVVLSKNIMHAAFALMFTLFGLAGFYAMLLSDFLAVSQIMIYVGGILVLIIFGVMLTSKITGVELKTGPVGKINYLLGGIIAVIVSCGLALLFTNSKWVELPVEEVPSSSITAIGNTLLTEYILVFEVAAVLLLIALIGAALIAHKDDISSSEGETNEISSKNEIIIKD